MMDYDWQPRTVPGMRKLIMGILLAITPLLGSCALLESPPTQDELDSYGDEIAAYYDGAQIALQADPTFYQFTTWAELFGATCRVNIEYADAMGSELLDHAPSAEIEATVQEHLSREYQANEICINASLTDEELTSKLESEETSSPDSKLAEKLLKFDIEYAPAATMLYNMGETGDFSEIKGRIDELRLEFPQYSDAYCTLDIPGC